MITNDYTRNSIIAKNIRYLRVQNNNSQKEIAALLKLSESVYSRRERNQSQFTPDELYTLAKYFQTTVDAILSEDMQATEDCKHEQT